MDAGTARRHDDDRHVVVARAGPALVSRDLEEIDGVESVVAELYFCDRASACVRNSHGGPDDSPFVERRIPGRPATLESR